MSGHPGPRRSFRCRGDTDGSQVDGASKTMTATNGAAQKEETSGLARPGMREESVHGTARFREYILPVRVQATRIEFSA